MLEPSRPAPLAAAGPPPPVARPASIGRRLRGSVLANATSLGTSLLTYFTLTRLVDPADYGSAALVTSLWGLCSIATDWGGDTVVRYGPVEFAGSGSLRTTVSTRLVFTSIALALLLPGAPLYFGVARHFPLWLLLLTDVYFVANAALGVAHWSAVAVQRFQPLALSNAVVRAAPLVAIVSMRALHQRVGAEALIVATVGGTIGGGVLLLAALRPLLGLVRPDRALLAAMWRYSRPVLFAAPSIALTTYIDPIILRRSVSHADVGRYQLAYMTVTLFGMAGASFNGVLSPELVRARAAGDGGTFDRYRTTLQPSLALALGLAAFAGACVAGTLVRPILPASWAGAADLVAILTVAGGMMLGVWSFYPLVTVTDNTPVLQLAAVSGAATNVALDLLLAPRLGAVGVAVANVVAWSVQLSMLSLTLHRRIAARRRALLLLPAALPVLWLVVTHARLPLRALAAVALAAGALAIARRAHLMRARRAS